MKNPETRETDNGVSLDRKGKAVNNSICDERIGKKHNCFLSNSQYSITFSNTSPVRQAETCLHQKIALVASCWYVCRLDEKLPPEYANAPVHTLLGGSLVRCPLVALGRNLMSTCVGFILAIGKKSRCV